jgi:hypothetical protein
MQLCDGDLMKPSLTLHTYANLTSTMRVEPQVRRRPTMWRASFLPSHFGQLQDGKESPFTPFTFHLSPLTFHFENHLDKVHQAHARSTTRPIGFGCNTQADSLQARALRCVMTPSFTLLLVFFVSKLRHATSPTTRSEQDCGCCAENDLPRIPRTLMTTEVSRHT